MVTGIENMSRQELLGCIENKKNEMAQKIKNGEIEESFAIGGASYTNKEWDRLIKRVDRAVGAVKEQQEERKREYIKALYQEGASKNSIIIEKLNGTYAGDVPYGHLAHDGVIEYNGVVFFCDNEKNAICLGDMSNRKNVITIPLSEGGSLMVNRDNIGDLSNAISMFSPEDQKRILCAIADDNKARETLKEIDDETNSIGEDAEENIFGAELEAL